MEHDVVTRIATPDDADELARLNGLFNRVFEQSQTLALRMENTRQVETAILAEMESRVIGFAAARVVPCVCYATAYAELTELFVEEAWRRRRVGRTLVEHA
ncbi:MAG: GNAT family N-acetyltransferase, partial [Candidatus Hydrogenedentes bacterium]|nr:GNAT family N-acetyltransferase [Candidatus Hydrogenedentota bacterium]